MSAIKPETLNATLDTPTTHWPAIANVVLAGIAVALHVGKATIALPELQREFGRSLESLSWIIGAGIGDRQHSQLRWRGSTQLHRFDRHPRD